jgi:hypothetical protein
MPARSTSARALAIRLSSPLVRRRFPRSRIRSMARWLALITITQQLSCAGGGGVGTPINNNVDLTLSVSITLSPASAQITAGASVQFLVTVQNASNPAVTWQVNGIPGGSPAVGTITPSGAATASYAAPASVSSPLMVTVAAVLQSNPTTASSAMVTINPLPPPKITISPANPTVVTGGSQQFTASVQNGSQAVIWEVNNIAGGSATSGTISSSGFYAAPTQIPNPSAVTITALLFSDSSVSGSTRLTIVPPTPTVSISPSTANVIGGQTLQFSAIVQNSTAAAIWQVNGLPGGSQADGTIAVSGLYTATYSAPSVSSPLTVTVTAVLQSNPPLSASAGVTVVPLNTFTGVYSWRNDNRLTGQNAQEAVLTPLSVSSTTGSTFKKLFGCAVDGQIFAQPLYVANVMIGSISHNVVYVATEHDSVYAFDADANPCQTLWQVSLIDPGATTVPANDPNLSGQTDIVPEIGITGTPVIDPSTAALYVVSKSRTLVNGSPAYTQKLHALDLAAGWVGGVAGAEKFGGPAIIQAFVNGNGDGTNSGTISFQSMSLTENQRSALLLTAGNVYVAFDSYSDTDPFHGWLFAYDAADLRTAPAVFISTQNGTHGGIGESGAAPSADANGNVFAATSDGTFDANSGGPDYAETLLKLQTNGATASFTVADSFTPWNQSTLNFTHRYFGSTGVLLLPDSAGSSAHPNLALAGNELGNLYLVDRNNLGGFSSTPGVDNIVQTLSLSGSNFGTPAYWAANNTVYVAAAGDNLRALPLSSGMLSSLLCSPPSFCSADTFPSFGASPVISSNGSTAGIVWALDTSGYVTSSPAVLHAYDATNLANELYVSPSSTGGPASPAGPAVKFAVPTVANGKVYIGTQNELSVFGLQ